MRIARAIKATNSPLLLLREVDGGSGGICEDMIPGRCWFSLTASERPVVFRGVMGPPDPLPITMLVGRTSLVTSCGEEGVMAGGDKLREAGSFELFVAEIGVVVGAEGDILNAPARARAIEEALEKRAAGSLARACMMTSVRAGVTFGLMRAGGVGVVLTCCMMMEAIFSA